MSDYTLQLVDDRKNVLHTLRLECSDDDAAVEEVAHHHLSTDAELWCGTRLIRTFRSVAADEERCMTRQAMVRHDGRLT